MTIFDKSKIHYSALLTMVTQKYQSKQNGVHISLDELIQYCWQAKKLAFSTRKPVMTTMGGVHHSGFRGHGIDFLETRRYLPGDDIRAIDWRVTARFKKAHTKVFSEERERPVFFLVDYGPQMFFGTRNAFKSVVAARAAAILACAAKEQGDRVGGLIFSPTQLTPLRPEAGQRGPSGLFKAMVANHSLPTQTFQPGYLNSALIQLRQIASTGSLIIILSDFQGIDDNTKKHLSQLARYNHIIGLFIYDQLEQKLPPAGLYDITDGQRAWTINTTDSQLIQRHQTQFKKHQTTIETLFRQQHLQLLSLATDQSIFEVLQLLNLIKK